MSQDKGKRAAGWFAEWLRAEGYFANAQELPNGRSGADIENTPPVAFEVKTGVTWRDAWLKQAAKYAGDIHPLIYAGPGMGRAQVADWQMVLRVRAGMDLLRKAGYCE